ncbi:MAG: hypothetical protein K2X86_18850, partial [Cytophagaceae bacterium]|nr:hypothetical protein [Cytophagaceae bacterium]
MNAIYYDMVDVKEDIKSFVNIEKYGDLHYKKMTLSEHSRQLFHQNDIKNFHRVTDKKELSSLIELISYSDHSDYLFISSNLAIINKEAFAHFLKKIKYVESSLTVCDCDCIRPLLKFSKSEAVDFLKLMMSDNCTLHQAIENKANSFERFSQECFYLEIKNYKDFVSYLQNDFELRYFNSIKSTRHVLTKKSSQKEKMLKEFTYYSVLPDEMKIFFLPPFNFKEHKEHAEYSMERLNILDVSLQWIHFSMNQDEFRKLLDNLFFFLSNRWEREAGKQELKSIVENLYLEKLEERVKAFKQTPVYNYVNEVIANST